MYNQGYYNNLLKDKYKSKYTYKDKYDKTTNTNDVISVSCNLHKIPFNVTLKEHLDGKECPVCTLRGYNNVKIGDKIGPYNIELMSNLIIKQYVKGSNYIYATFKCNNCGELYNTRFDGIKNGDTKVCKKCPNVVRKIYNIGKIGRLWYGIKRRCYNKKSQDYKNYGALGITMSDDWLHYPNFEAWVLEQVDGDVSKLGVGKLTIDRKNPYLGYSESNCRFSSPTVQSRNIRYNLNLPMGYMGVNMGYMGVNKSFFRVAYKVRLAIGRQKLYLGAYPTKYQCLVARENYIEKHNLEHSRFPYTVVPEILDFSYNDLKMNKITEDNKKFFELFIGCYLNKANINHKYQDLVSKNIADLNEIVKVIKSLKYTFDSSKYYYVCETFYNGKLIINAHMKKK